jgi:hypothetical protein
MMHEPSATSRLVIPTFTAGSQKFTPQSEASFPKAIFEESSSAIQSTEHSHDRHERHQYRSYQGTPNEPGREIKMRQIKYLNNMLEQDHRSIKLIVRSIMEFKSFRSTRVILQGIELMHMILKGRMISGDSQDLSDVSQFYLWLKFKY